jgi:hypothetical protein
MIKPRQELRRQLVQQTLGGQLNAIRFLATFGDALRTGTWTRRVKGFPLSYGELRPAHLHVGKRCETSKSPHFTKSGQEPNLD